MAFQAVDDSLVLTATAADLGKPVGGDLLAGTLTLPSILLMEAQPGENVVRRLFAATEEAARQALLEAVLAEIRASDILDRSQATAREWRDKALGSLAALAPKPERVSLEEIAAFVVGRSF